MEKIIFPEIFGHGVKAFFTGKNPGADLGRISEIASIAEKRIYMPIQKHTDKVLVLDSDFDPKIADAVVTRQRGILIGVQTADCVPVLLYDKDKQVAGAIHAGWRGTAARILKETIKTMMDCFCSSPPDIFVAIGPGIKWCCYDVGYEVIEAVRKATEPVRGPESYFIKRGDKYCLDLQTANKYQALSVGVPERNFWISEECTYCNPDRFYSYRYGRGPTGRQGGFIGVM